MICPVCSAVIDDNAKFCPKCGTAARPAHPPPASPQRGAQPPYGGQFPYSAPPPVKQKSYSKILIPVAAAAVLAIAFLALLLTGNLPFSKNRRAPAPDRSEEGSSISHTDGDAGNEAETGAGEASAPDLQPGAASAPNAPAPAALFAPPPPGTNSGVMSGGGDPVGVTGDTNLVFTPDKSGVWEIRTSDSGGGDPFLEVFDANGVSIAYNDDAAGNLDAVVYVDLVLGRSYTIFTGFYLGVSYSATVTATYVDPSGSQQTSEPIRLSGRTRTHRVRVNGPTTIIFESAFDGFWVVYTSDNGDSDPMLRLYSESGELIDEDDDGWGDLNSLIERTPLREEVYRIEVSFNGSSAGSCVVNILPPEDILMRGGSYPVTSTRGYTFRPEQDGIWELRTSDNGSFAPRLFIGSQHSPYNDNDDGTGENNNAVLTVFLRADETYHLLLRFHGGGPGSCTLNVTLLEPRFPQVEAFPSSFPWG